MSHYDERDYEEEAANAALMQENDDDYWLGPPCPDCVHARTCEACKAEDAYYAWMEERVERLGPDLAMVPDEMPCYDCGRHLPKRICQTDEWGMSFVMRRVVALGPIAEPHRDPTQTYRLVCHHGAM
jgi:hypothetical protein